ncbi:MAG TPA: helix-turn-helix domain-containing protein [Salinarimonas sp.]|nr:helix-turn-helix domain-containing protein [Salinarimonas sp.]
MLVLRESEMPAVAENALGTTRLGDYVARIRREKNLSLPEIRRRGGPGASTVNGIENGTTPDRPKRSTLEKLARGLGVPLAEVLEAAGELLPEDAPPPRQPHPVTVLPGRLVERMTDWEREVLDLMHEADMSHGVLMTPDFWARPPEARARFLVTVEDGARKALEMKRQIEERRRVQED